MHEPFEYYRQEKLKYEDQLTVLQKKIGRSSFIRIGLFIATVLIAYFVFQYPMVFAATLFTGIVLFTFAVVSHEKFVYRKNLVQHLIKINTIEIEALSGNYSTLDQGAEFVDPQHFFSNDIDLFGKRSFFQYINRTTTRSGKIKLAQMLTANDTHDIVEKQFAVKELSQKPDSRQRFMALSKMVTTEIDNKIIVSWIENYLSFLPESMKKIPLAFSGISIILMTVSAFGLLPFSMLIIWFVVGLIITLAYFKRINKLYQDAGNIKSTFKQFHLLLDEIENYDLNSKLLIQEQLKIKSSVKNASVIFREFSKILDAFDQRNNMIFGVLGNGLFLWDLHHSYQIEKWINKYHDQVEKWFEVIAFFDAQISLANYAFNHPKHSFPSIISNEVIMEARALGHPLIQENIRINNDFKIKNNDFVIITGANMAGKSTFLRTISLAVVMANNGLPVCAEKLDYSPVKLITSMRTSDSLAEESSYFYAEIMRLKFIVEQMKSEQYFIILDEILKGTNSKDKAIGSRKFVERLVKSGSTGIIATHDLSLCDIEKDYDQIHNKYFDALLKNDELQFDYLLKEGICTNMNASFLLKKMEII